MASTSNVIILPPSSPERTFARSPTPVAYSPERLFGFPPQGSSPPAMRSPSTLFRPPSPSATKTESPKNGSENRKTPLAEGVWRENLPVTTTGERESTNKLKRVKKKSAEERQTVLTDLETVSCESQTNAAKKTTNGNKGRLRTTSKHEKSGNKTLNGRVSKGDSSKASEAVKQAATLPLLELSEPQAASKNSKDWENEGLQLEEATKRRLDWTPTKDTEARIINLDGDDDCASSQEPSSRPSFGDLFLSYGFNGPSRLSQENTKKTDEGGPTKKRRIEVCHG